MASELKIWRDAMNKGIDPYLYIASKYYERPVEEISKSQRSYIKEAMFSILYLSSISFDVKLDKLISEYEQDS